MRTAAAEAHLASTIDVTTGPLATAIQAGSRPWRIVAVTASSINAASSTVPSRLTSL